MDQGNDNRDGTTASIPDDPGAEGRALNALKDAKRVVAKKGRKLPDRENDRKSRRMDCGRTVTIRFDADDFGALVRRSEEDGANMSDTVRTLIRLGLDNDRISNAIDRQTDGMTRIGQRLEDAIGGIAVLANASDRIESGVGGANGHVHGLRQDIDGMDHAMRAMLNLFESLATVSNGMSMSISALVERLAAIDERIGMLAGALAGSPDASGARSIN